MPCGLGVLEDEFDEVHDAVGGDEPGEKDSEAFTIVLVGEEDAEEDGDAHGREEDLCGIKADDIGTVVSDGRGDGDGDVHGHGGGHVDVVMGWDVVSQEECQAGKHDEGAPNSGESAEQSGSESDKSDDEGLIWGHMSDWVGSHKCFMGSGIGASGENGRGPRRFVRILEGYSTEKWVA